MAGERKAQEEERRALYVGMTRARRTLSVVDTMTDKHSLVRDLEGPWILRRRWDRASDSTSRMTEYSMLGLEDIHLGYPGLFPAGQPVHAALNRLQPRDLLTFTVVHEGRNRGAAPSKSESESDARRESPPMTLYLQDRDGMRVARLARGAEAEWLGRLATVREVRVVAMIHRIASQDPDVERRGRYRTGEWEVPLVEVVSDV
jgi:ATP-dependent DNA helicase RecQ